MGTLDQETLRELWRVSPAATAAHLSRNYRNPWLPARHLLHLSNIIVNAVTGQGPRFVIVSMPVRHGKSEEGSKWTPVWYLENWPDHTVMLLGHGSEFAAKWGGAVRNISINHEEELSFTLAPDSKAKYRWNTTAGGGMVTAGVGGDITGRGANLLIIDDPIKNHEDVATLIARDKLWEWWTSTSSSRIEPGAAVLLLMARWHEDDLAGRLLNPEYNREGYRDWTEVNFPAIYDPQMAARGPDPLGRNPNKVTTVILGDGSKSMISGEALWPERWPLQELALKRRASLEDWASLYQGVPPKLISKGNVYHNFSDTENVRRCEFDPDLDLFLGLDFNVDPMCGVFGQYRRERTAYTHLTNQMLVRMEVLGEICLPNSNTKEFLEAFVSRTRNYVNIRRGGRLNVRLYGDASGNQRSTNGDQTDYQIIRQYFNRFPEYSVTYHITKENPSVRSRVNAVNEVLLTADGFRRLHVDVGCMELRRDFKEVKWKTDAGGNSTGTLDKGDKKRTHISDALGYVIYHEFGIRNVVGEKSEVVR